MPDAARATPPPATPHAAPQIAVRGAHVGQHRRPTGALRTVGARARRGVDLVARLGGAVTLASLLVLGLAVAGAVDGGAGPVRPTTPTVTVTIAGR